MIEWKPEGPPKRRNGVPVYAPIIAELKTKPGVWAVVRRLADLRTGTRGMALRALKAAGALAESHKAGDVIEIWACWPEEPKP